MSIEKKLLSWYQKNHRKLPFRETKDPYKIWLSEIIFQQTRIDQGLPYYEKFIRHYPTIFELAKASEQEVLKDWQGLGYYSRARNLHFTAQFVMENLDGEFPNNYLDIKQLKGIGSYTAAAIASISFNEAVAAIDGNALRVLSRYFGVKDDIAKEKNKKKFFELGNEIISKEHPGDFNQAIMELGATVCLPKNQAKCTDCPLNDSCYALAHQKVEELPIKSKTVKVKEETISYVVHAQEDGVWMKKRSSKGIWKNMYDFPEVEETKKLMLIHEQKHLLTHRDDVKLYSFENDRHLARFPIATSESFTNNEGERVEQTDWHNIVVYNRQAQTCEKYLSKGDKVLVEGKIKNRKWEDQNGQMRYSTDIVASRVEFLITKNNPAAGGNQPPVSPEEIPSPPEPTAAPEEADDLPF
ncbi:unnamed protein product [Cyprideis torosa]|uniref:Adenine DNA glycosylase n=1 Tax=Cyprideis torosa TaxID=163714 RepID=A0A7R8ZUG7_9CRUS|nr:unnamed protein product [Cyprideis torosa]CAG0900588.1 unnamed protein product [Cyprideis torosa]